MPAILIYLATIVLANYATSHFGLVSLPLTGLAVTAGTFAAGLSLVARDGVQRSFNSRLPVLVTILVGVLLSYLLADPFIALASGAAFLFSELVDWGVFSKIQTRSIPAAVLTSSIVSAPVDTVLFLHIAGFGVTWPAVLGQFIVKTAIAAAVALYMRRRGR